METVENLALATLNIIDGILAFRESKNVYFSPFFVLFSTEKSIESSIFIASDRAKTKDNEFLFFKKLSPPHSE